MALDLSAVQNLVATWWFEYDQGNFAVWPGLLTSDTHFSCRSDSGATAFEEFVTADVTGRDDVLAWQIEHRRNSPFPLRHNATNVHLTRLDDGEAEFRAYLFVTQIVGGAVSNLASGLCLGSIRLEGTNVMFSDMQVVLDFTDSDVFATVFRDQPA